MSAIAAEQRLRETIAWCDGRVRLDDPASCLRTAALRPAAPLDGTANDAAVVADVARRRASAVHTAGAARADATGGRGRLLVFDPGQSLSDGAAAAESNGLFDDDNTPAWDTWVCHMTEVQQAPDRWTAFDSYVLCWIPGALLELAERALEVNPEQCLRWAHQLDRPRLAELLRTLPPQLREQ